MARITVEDCLERLGNEKRFALVHLAVERVRQHRQGAPFLVSQKNKEIVMTLREIAAGKVTFENIQELPQYGDNIAVLAGTVPEPRTEEKGVKEQE